MRILVVEDAPKIAAFLEQGLREEGHRVEVAGDLESARAALARQPAELLLVDRMLPDGDGLDLVRSLRRAGDATPAICLTARDRLDERVQGLHDGADDYLVKPFAFDELLARIAAVSRRVGRATGVVVVADLEVDLDRHRVTRAGREVRLTAQEFALLRYLVENRGRVLSRARILENVWDTHHDPGSNVVDVYMSYLRAKVDKGFDRPLIHTVRGAGYLLDAEGR